MSNARFVRIGHFIIYKSKYMESNKLSLYEKIQAVSNEIKNLEKDMTVGKGTNAYKAISDKSVILAVQRREDHNR